jgi:hypothetical protein
MYYIAAFIHGEDLWLKIFLHVRDTAIDTTTKPD